MKINVFDIKFKTNPNQPIAMTKDPFILDVPDGADVKTAIDEFFMKSCGAVPTYCWTYGGGDESTDDDDNNLDDQYPSVDGFAEEIRHLLRRYFECDDNGDPNAEYDPDYTAQECIDDIRELVGNI